MRNTTRGALLLTAAAIAAHASAQAQQAPATATAAGLGAGSDAGSGAGAPIIVTATKKAGGEELQDVPIAITAFDEDALEALQVRDLQSLSLAAPGVSLDPVGTFRGVANFSIRGLGINSSIPSIDPTVGTIVDGVFLGVNAGVVFDLFDIASVEILRGPQGVLFGRNTTGGAVLINTADPTGDWRLQVRGSGEGPVDGGRGAMNMTMQAAVSGPLAGDALSFRLAGFYNSDGGYFRNLHTGGNFGKAETIALRGGIRADLGRLQITAKGEHFDSDGDGAVTQNHGLFARDSFAVSVDNEGFYRAQSSFAVLRADYALGNGTITNILGWRDFEQRTSNDIDSTPDFIFHSQTGLAQEQWSNELRYAGSFGPLDLTVGGYIFHQDVAYEEDRRLPAFTPLVSYGGGSQEHDVYGLFGQFDYRLTEALTLLAGLRWSREDKSAALSYVRTRPACSVIADTCPVSGTNPMIPGENNGITDERRSSTFSPKLGLSYEFGEDALAYASWTRGYRSGGYNLRVTAPAAFEAVAAASGGPDFGDERVDSYELGLKLASADRRASLNLAAYRTDVKGLQREINQASLTSGLVQSIYNTADARIWGFEAEGSFAVTPHLLVTANAAWIDAEYTDVFFDISGNGSVGPEDAALALPRVPEWSWGGSIVHRLPLGEVASLVSRVTFQHRDRFAYTDNNYGWVDAYDNLEAAITWNLPVEGMRLTVYGKNLLDEVQFGGDTQLPFGQGPFSDGDNRPFDPRPAAGTFSPLFKGRLIGVEVAMGF